MKKILGLLSVVLLASQFSYGAKKDPEIERLLKVAKQRQAEQAKEMKKQELMNELTDEGGTMPAATGTINVNYKRNAEAEARKAKLKEKAEARANKAKYKNMTESQKMDVEVQRIKKRVDEINSNLETFHKTNEMLDKMEERLEGIESQLEK